MANPVWDALEQELGYAPKAHETKLWGKISRDLTNAGADAVKIRKAAIGYAQMFPNATLTITALHKHYSAALASHSAVHKPVSTYTHDPVVKGVPLSAIQAAARGEWDLAAELGAA